jgi:threonine synthase
MCPNNDDGRLDIYYDYEALRKEHIKRTFDQRPATVWKYFELLPVEKEKNIVTLEAGGTRLIRSSNLAKKIGLKNLYIKDETVNPTGSFKDRSMTVGVSKAVEFGAHATATASSGNAAAALAAHAAKAGLKCYAFVLESASEAKLAQIRLYGTRVMRVRAVKNGKDPTVQMLKKIVENYGWYPCPSFGPFNPYQVEGPKTMSYELIEQLDWCAPHWVMVPTGSGCLLTGIWKGFKDFQQLDLVESIPRLAAIQSEGCAPLVRAFERNDDSLTIEPWGRPNTIAGGLSDVYPWDGDAALSALKETDGIADKVSDSEILESQKLLASTEGIFAEPTGVAALAGLIKLVQKKVIKKDEVVVLLVTGHGLKDPQVVAAQFGKTPTIDPFVHDFENAARECYGVVP